MSNRHITLPKGFLAAGVRAGIKLKGEDLAVIAADAPAATAVLTTTNQVFGEPVRWIRTILPKGYGTTRGMVINSGCSNVCTGKAGYRDARTMAADTAALLHATPEEIVVASTGIIGHRLPMDKIRAGIAAAGEKLAARDDDAVARAILTTDTRPKTAVVQDRIGGRTITVAGIAKGSGMIAPSMATMIAVVTTDAKISPKLLHTALSAAGGRTFNAITVDSDTSTSDTLAVFASGAAGGQEIEADSAGYRKFVSMLTETCEALARAIVVDGEGATKLVRIAVRGALSDADAALAAKSVANSPLFKCAIHGGDPNWGRIAAALGKSPAKVDPDTLTIKIGGITLFARGGPKPFDVKAVEQHLAGSEIDVDCSLGLGKGEFTAWTCDLSREYITINADYHT